MNIAKQIKSNLGFIIVCLVTLLLVFNPTSKALVMSGLMKVGLFQPHIDKAFVLDEQVYLPETIAFADAKGNMINTSEQKGKVLFINFWATWCPPCIAEMSSINELYNKFKGNKDVLFLMVDVDGNTKRSLKFMERRKYDLPVHTPASQIPSSILDGSIPTTLIVDKRGKIVFKREGSADYSNKDFIKFMEELSSKGKR